MDAEPGSSLILWTARLFVALYAAAVWRYLYPSGSGQTDVWQARLWFAAWLICVIHVCCAFQFEHKWSHASAVLHTAEQTERSVGVRWGGGVWLNYLFLAWWGWDAIRLLGRRTRVTSGVLQIVAAFMMFNATVVFGPAWWWIPVPVFVLVLIIRRRIGGDSGQKTPDLQ